MCSLYRKGTPKAAVPERSCMHQMISDIDALEDFLRPCSNVAIIQSNAESYVVL